MRNILDLKTIVWQMIAHTKACLCYVTFSVKNNLNIYKVIYVELILDSLMLTLYYIHLYCTQNIQISKTDYNIYNMPKLHE